MSEETSPCQKRNDEVPKHRNKFFEDINEFTHKYIYIYVRTNTHTHIYIYPQLHQVKNDYFCLASQRHHK